MARNPLSVRVRKRSVSALARAGCSAMNLPGRQRGGIFVRVFFLVLVPLVGGAAGLYWYALGGRYVVTDNAYVKADMIAISASIDGRVVEVMVEDNQPVKQGETLFVLDPRPYEIARTRAEARMAAVHNELASKRAAFAQVAAEIADARERVKYLRGEQSRQEDLTSEGADNTAAIDTLKYESNAAVQALQVLHEKARQVLAALGGDLEQPVAEHPRYLEAQASRKEAELALEYATVRAPAGGIPSRVQLQPGEWVQRGRPVFSLIDARELWIEANLKETQLTHVAPGQAVIFEVDAYPGVDWKGVVARISPATGSEFMVLPPQNATGNWIKVVQRIPVRVEFDSAPGHPELRAGMTATVSVDTGQERKLLSMLNDLALVRVTRDAVASISGRN